MNKLQRHYRRVVLYARVSTEEQAEGEYPSPTSQFEELEAVCKEAGWKIAERVTDVASARSLDRPGLTEVRRLVQSGSADLVMTTWYDRLVRGRHFFQLDDELREAGVQFIAHHERIDTSTAVGTFQEHIAVGVATFQSDQTREKVRAKMRQRAEKGLWNGGWVPYGYTYDKNTKRLLVDRAEARVVRRIFASFVRTGGYTEIREQLEAEGIRTRRGSTRWSLSTLNTLLANPVCMGKFRIGGSSGTPGPCAAGCSRGC
jgi:site-specific DNA recombinase